MLGERMGQRGTGVAGRESEISSQKWRTKENQEIDEVDLRSNGVGDQMTFIIVGSDLRPRNRKGPDEKDDMNQEYRVGRGGVI